MAKKNQSNGISNFIAFGSGIVLGALVAPHAKKWLKDAQPIFDDILDGISKGAGKAAEKSSDIIAEAKEKFKEKPSS